MAFGFGAGGFGETLGSLKVSLQRHELLLNMIRKKESSQRLLLSLDGLFVSDVLDAFSMCVGFHIGLGIEF